MVIIVVVGEVVAVVSPSVANIESRERHTFSYLTGTADFIAWSFRPVADCYSPFGYCASVNCPGKPVCNWRYVNAGKSQRFDSIGNGSYGQHGSAEGIVDVVDVVHTSAYTRYRVTLPSHLYYS